MKETVIVLALFSVTILCGFAAAQDTPSHWNAPDRAAKVSRLIPGRKVARLTRETLFADWTAAQLARWRKDHPDYDPAAMVEIYANAAPADAELLADFPVHITPLGRVREGKPATKDAALNVLYRYCPFCGSRTFDFTLDRDNPYHAVTDCCDTHLYGRQEDYPDGYRLKATETVAFPHLDGTKVEVPCTVYRDKDGVVWELFVKTFFDQQRWFDVGCERVKRWDKAFRETADPKYAHKIAAVLDRVADTYYGLPLCFRNELARSKDGEVLTRAEWEKPREPNVFEATELGLWNRRKPDSNKGWINMSNEHIWVEPFARVRHHPQFKAYSQAVYGDPEALDKKIAEKLLDELALMFKQVFAQKLMTNYQEANYSEMTMLGVLLSDDVLLEFTLPNTELTIYNHTYHDGLNGQGAPNYMAMPGGYFYPYLRDPDGWLLLYPDFHDDHPFCEVAGNEFKKLRTLRGMWFEFGDQHLFAYLRHFKPDAAKARAAEAIPSRNWADWGVGVLRVGGPGHRQEMVLTDTRAVAHGARDALGLSVWFDGVPVMRRGGYATWGRHAPLQWERPEYRALKTMGYPYEMVEGEKRWVWDYAHSPLSQNTVTVDDVPTSRGWGEPGGYGETVTFKGSRGPDDPGRIFQVLDVRDRYNFSAVGRDVKTFRRTLIAVEGPGGRPYVVDLLTLDGGRIHTYYQSAWAERLAADLPPVAERAGTLNELLFDGKPPADTVPAHVYDKVRKVSRHNPAAASWSVTWETDIAAFDTKPLDAPDDYRSLPDDVGRVRMRAIGLDPVGGGVELISGKGPWTGWVKQPLPGGHEINGNVNFLDARDFLIERRRAAGDEAPLRSLFTHVIEGYRHDEESAIASVELVKAESTAGPERDVVTIRIAFKDGRSDTVIYQSAPGSVRLADGATTDARYALVRRDDAGEVAAIHGCRGTVIEAGEARLAMPGDYTGTIVDVIGDLTGDRHQSALVLKTERPWPEGEALSGRQLLARIESPLREACNEGYRIAKVTNLPGGRVRVDLQDHAPFIDSWHQVTELPAGRPKRAVTNRPIQSHASSPWYRGMTAWFPERGRTYSIDRTAKRGGGWGGHWFDAAGEANLKADGIRKGDWFVIYAIRPGLEVNVAGEGFLKK